MGKFFCQCSLVLVIVVLSTVSFADEHFPFLGKINADGINVRAGANTNYERIDQLPKDAIVIVYGRQFEWYQVQLAPTAQIFIRADYLKQIENDVYEIIGDRVNVRARASSDAAAIGQLTLAKKVRVTDIVNGWAKIVAPKGLSGWVNQKFVVLSSESVPEDMLPKDVTVQPEIAQPLAVVDNKNLEVKSIQEKSIQVTAKGFIKPALNTPDAKVQYQLFVDDKPVYYLIDVPNLGQFSSHQVKVVGTLRPSKSQDLPTLIVTDISLVM